jgi:hypothetical protein
MVQKPIAMSAIAPVAVAAILMLGTLAALSTINHASAQESSNTGNATDFASNPEKQPCGTCADPLQEMVPAMKFAPHEILKCPATPLSEPVVDCTTINHASAQESSNTGNATDFASNPEKQPCGTCINSP